MDFVGEKIAAVSATLSHVTRGHIEKFSADELASMIEALIRDKFGYIYFLSILGFSLILASIAFSKLSLHM